MEEEDERREAAIASAPSLQPNFKPDGGGGVTKHQISKFQELHRRRLQIKEKTTNKKKSKGIVDRTSKSHGMAINAKDCTDENTSKTIEDSTILISKSCDIKDICARQQDVVAASIASRKRQKLHWGLDTKERWERKSNM
ncbi:unnamed protein product [Ilex paraguariensis]|uniref:Uncharacterized protein n=1 Tax=Ilex paraguariensis TaxID=185542 RepID=A0ABC8RXZ6_9AQUA